jgi:hypothetical protein
VLIEPTYKGYRIEANAVAEGDRWNCDVKVRRTLSQDKPHRERVTCFKVTPGSRRRRGPCGRGGGLTPRSPDEVTAWE